MTLEAASNILKERLTGRVNAEALNLELANLRAKYGDQDTTISQEWIDWMQDRILRALG